MAPPRAAANGRLDSRPRSDTTGSPPPPGVHRLHLGGSAEAVLAVPEAGAQPWPLLVFFHGAGGSAANSVTAVGEVLAARGVLLLAPSSVASTWDLIAGGLGRDVAVLDAALEAVFASCPVSRVGMGGFSDGGSYALSLGVANGDLAEALLAFSPGFLAPPAQVGEPRIWISHGDDDRVLPVDRCGRRVSRELAAAGYEVSYDEFSGGHVVRPDRVTAALDWWLGPAGR